MDHRIFSHFEKLQWSMRWWHKLLWPFDQRPVGSTKCLNHPENSSTVYLDTEGLYVYTRHYCTYVYLYIYISIALLRIHEKRHLFLCIEQPKQTFESPITFEK